MRRIAVIFGALALLLLAAWWSLREERGRGRAGSRAAAAQAASEPAPARRTSGPAPEGREELGSAPAPPAAATPATIPLTFCVLRASDRAPLAGVVVELLQKGGTLGDTTDERGEARLDLAGTRRELGDVALVQVAHSRDIDFYQSTRDERVLFRGSVVLGERVVLLVEECVELRGRVVDALGLPVPVRAVQAFEPGVGARHLAVFLARDTEIGSDAQFSLRVCGRRPVPEVLLELAYAGGACRVPVSWAELAGAEGALVRLELGEYLAEVRDERGRPLAGALVRARPAASAAGFPAELETGAAGQARFLFPRGDAYASAGMPGHAPAAMWFLRPPGGRPALAPLTLRTLSDQEEVRGLVRLADGRPVAGALVTAVPPVAIPDADLGGAGMVQVTCGADGRFRLPWPADQALELVAHGRGRGLSRTHLAPPGEREVELVIEEQGGLVVQLAPVDFAPEYTGGLVEYVLRTRASAAITAEHAFGVPFELGELPVGDHDLWVLDHGWGAWAEGFARVEAGQATPVTLPAHPLQRARGTLRQADGSPARGVRLRPLVPGWPDALAEIWTATVAADGRFELILGASAAAHALPLEEGRVHVPLPLAAGDGQDLVLPRN